MWNLFISFRPAAAKKKPNGRGAGRGDGAWGLGPGLGWAELDGTICRVGLPCAAFLAASPWFVAFAASFLVYLDDDLRCDLAQRLGDGAEEVDVLYVCAHAHVL